MRGVAVLALSSFLVLSGCLNEFDEEEPPNFLRISGIDVSAPVVKSGTITLAVNVTLDNLDAQSQDVRLVAKGYDQSTGLLVTAQSADVGQIPEDRTISVEVLLDVPRSSGYRIEVQVYEDDQLTIQGTVTASNIDALPPNVFDTGLRISMMDFIVRNVSGSRVEISAKVYVTNEGTTASQPLDIQIKAREISTSLLADEEWTQLPSVATEETVPTEVTLDVPDEYNYRIEAILWDGNIMVERGAQPVQLLPNLTKDPNEEIVVTNPNVDDFIRGPGGGGGSIDTARSPAAGVLLIAIAVFGATALAARSVRK